MIDDTVAAILGQANESICLFEEWTFIAPAQYFIDELFIEWCPP